ncbi:unnamed protein product [Pedinophyceae sp. YPF-701]|nr:unnamed protein product [Pedinophyceae sp. YPF-701]
MTAPPTLESVLREAPALLDALPAASKRAVAATSWTVLLTVLELTRAELRMHARSELLRSIAARMPPGTQPAAGSLCLQGLCRAMIPADEAGALVAALDACRGRLPRIPAYLDQLLVLERVFEASERLGRPLRLRGIKMADGETFLMILTQIGSASGEHGDVLLDLLESNVCWEHLRVFKLDLGEVDPMVVEALGMLAESRHLEELSIIATTMGSRALRQVVETVGHLAELRKLRLSGIDVNLESGVFFETLEEHPSIEEAHLEPTLIGRRSIAALDRLLRENTSLRKLRLPQIYMFANVASLELGRAIGAGLAANTTLAELDLLHADESSLEDEFYAEVARGLLRNTTLQALSLGQECPDAAVATIAAAIKQGLPLRRLVLRGVAIDGGAAELARVLSARSCMTELDLTDCEELSTEAVLELAGAIERGALGGTLETLSLQRVSAVAAEGFVALGKALCGNRVVRKLDVRENAAVGDEGAAALGGAMEAGCVLEEVVLLECGVTDVGAIALAAGLQGNTTLRVLDLAGNSICTAGAVALMDALGEGSAVRELTLRDQQYTDGQAPLEDAAADAYARALRRGSALSRLEVTNANVMTAGALREVVDAMVECSWPGRRQGLHAVRHDSVRWAPDEERAVEEQLKARAADAERDCRGRVLVTTAQVEFDIMGLVRRGPIMDRMLEVNDLAADMKDV